MSLDRRRAASDKLPSSSTGTLLNREQLRRQLSAHAKTGETPPVSNTPDAEYMSNELRFEDGSAADQSATVDPRPSGPAPMKTLTPPDEYKRVSSPVRVASSDEGGVLEAEVSLYEDEDKKITGVVVLSTLHQRRVSHIKVRVICLIDVSGSMLLKGDKRNLRSKISIMKSMAVDIIDALEDDEDFFGVMTFGEHSRMICPLTRVTSAVRAQVKMTVSGLDKDGGFSSVTDLSSALLQAVDMLTAAQKDEGLLYRNSIIIFSDGEINAGETDPSRLVHVTREKIRECTMPSTILADLWVNISCVTTGSNFSHSLYLVSKLCGSDAYYFVDGSKEHPEADMLIPLMLRKTACAQMISLTVQASNGVLLETAKCSQEYSVRRKRGQGVDRYTMAYFIHDMPTGVKKTFQISLDARGASLFEGSFLRVDVQYVDPLGVLRNVSKSIQRQEVVSLQPGTPRALEIVARTGVTSLRQVFQNTCRNVANILENVDSIDANHINDSVNAAIQAGNNEIQALAAQVLLTLEDSSLRSEFESFANAIAANLTKLQALVQDNAAIRGKCWQFAKAMSSAVVRELPTVTNVLARPQVVCPLPEMNASESRRTQALSVYVFGAGDELGRATQIHNAAKDVAKSLADVLSAFQLDS